MVALLAFHPVENGEGHLALGKAAQHGDCPGFDSKPSQHQRAGRIGSSLSELLAFVLACARTSARSRRRLCGIAP